MTRMPPPHEAMCRTLAAVLGHDRDTEETAADIIAGLNAAGYLIAPFEPHECICPLKNRTSSRRSAWAVPRVRQRDRHPSVPRG